MAYAVIFTSTRTPGDNGYASTAERMDELARTMPGYLGIESARNPDGFGITVSYWADEASILNWKQQMEHLEAQSRGRKEWYLNYTVRIAKVEREYSFPVPGPVADSAAAVGK